MKSSDEQFSCEERARLASDNERLGKSDNEALSKRVRRGA